MTLRVWIATIADMDEEGALFVAAETRAQAKHVAAGAFRFFADYVDIRVSRLRTDGRQGRGGTQVTVDYESPGELTPRGLERIGWRVCPRCDEEYTRNDGPCDRCADELADEAQDADEIAEVQP